MRMGCSPARFSTFHTEFSSGCSPLWITYIQIEFHSGRYVPDFQKKWVVAHAFFKFSVLHENWVVAQLGFQSFKLSFRVGIELSSSRVGARFKNYIYWVVAHVFFNFSN